MILLGFCRAGNIERTHQEMSTILNLDLLEPEQKHLDKWKRKREKDSKRIRGEEGKKRRHEAKALKDIIMMKEDAKKRHRSGKVSVKKSSKVTKKRGAARCGKCHQPGHNRLGCLMPEIDRVPVNADLLDWVGDTPKVTRSRGKQYKPDLIDWTKC